MGGEHGAAPALPGSGDRSGGSVLWMLAAPPNHSFPHPQRVFSFTAHTCGRLWQRGLGEGAGTAAIKGLPGAGLGFCCLREVCSGAQLILWRCSSAGKQWKRLVGLQGEFCACFNFSVFWGGFFSLLCVLVYLPVKQCPGLVSSCRLSVWFVFAAG